VARFSRRNQSAPTPRLEPRIMVLTAMIMAVLAGAVLRLYYLQLIKHHEMAELSDRNRIRLQRLPALRGLVFDARHRALVDTRPSFDAVVVPEDSPDISATTERLQKAARPGWPREEAR
jgi:penicillin-binding protein 2